MALRALVATVWLVVAAVGPAWASAVDAAASASGAASAAGSTAAATKLTAAKDSASGLYGYRNAAGAWAVQPAFMTAYDFDGGLAFVEYPDRATGIIDKTGELVTPNVDREIWIDQPDMTLARMSEGLLAARDAETNKVGFVDARGDWVIKPRFADAHEFHEGLAAFRMSERGRIGFIDKHGKVVIAARYASNFRTPPVFSEGLAAVGLNEAWPRTNLDPPGKIGFIDRRGQWVVKPTYESVDGFRNGEARVRLNGRETALRNPLKR